MSHRNIFNTTPVKRPGRNIFDLGHDVKFSCDMGRLVPILLQECLPGDFFKIRSEVLIRFAPLVSPVMHNIRVFTHYFFVPNRIVWKKWEEFISADLGKESPPVWPYMVTQSASNNKFEEGSLGDYFGLPTDATVMRGSLGTNEGTDMSISAIPFGAYKLIYDEYYRDQNLQPKLPNICAAGLAGEETVVSSGGNFLQDWCNKADALPRRAWQHDYFTAALPFAQKGPAVEIPIGGFGDVDVYWKGVTGMSDPGMHWIDNQTGNPAPADTDLTVKGSLGSTSNPASTAYYALDPGDRLAAKTSDLDGTQATINDLRVALRLQEYFEKAARGGTRYVEQLMVHFAVRSDDARMNRPEFIGGTRQPVIISEVLQTSSSDDETPQGNMAGHGLSAGSGKTLSYYCKEHGYIIGIMSVMPATAYQQGVPRHFMRKSWEDYAWPTFAHLGEQEVKNSELYVIDFGDPDRADNHETFGYIPRYSEYRYTPSRVAGEFRSSLAFWHLGRIFDNMPVLNSEFIECDPRKDIFAVEEGQHLWCHAYNSVTVKRALPRYGVPTL